MLNDVRDEESNNSQSRLNLPIQTPIAPLERSSLISATLVSYLVAVIYKLAILNRSWAVEFNASSEDM